MRPKLLLFVYCALELLGIFVFHRAVADLSDSATSDHEPETNGPCETSNGSEDSDPQGDTEDQDDNTEGTTDESSTDESMTTSGETHDPDTHMTPAAKNCTTKKSPNRDGRQDVFTTKIVVGMIVGITCAILLIAFLMYRQLCLDGQLVW